MLLIFCLLLSYGTCLAEEPRTVITSGTLEYFAEGKRYVAKGSVEIEQEGSYIQADEIIFYEETSEALAEGNVRYEDKTSTFKAGKAAINLEAKTGKLFDAEIFYKKDNLHLSGAEIEKRGENYYYSPEAKITTCDSPLPEWCFRGKEVDAVIGDRIKARDVTFNIKGLPVFYTPYFWAPVLTERKTGFLIPVVSYGRSRGLNLKIPYFWAIAENRDATFLLDLYSRRGIGTGLEYRFKNPGGIESNWWVYHIRDTKLNKNFYELRVLHDHRRAGGLGGFLNLNLLNEKDFYREFNPFYELHTKRLLESTGEFNIPFRNSRLYFLAQYWQDLKYPTALVPQKLPEIGYVLNYTRAGPFMVSAAANAANISREGGLSALRLDLYPKVIHSFGKDFVITQEAAVRATVYDFRDVKRGSLKQCELACLIAADYDSCISKCKEKNEKYYWNTDVENGPAQRLAFEYSITGHTRLIKNYASFTHVVEPSVRYRFVSTSENNLPVLDSAELYKRTSTMELSLLNRIIVDKKHLAVLRLTQGFDTQGGSRAFLPLRLEMGIEKPLPLRLEATYDYNSGKVETVSSDLSFTVATAKISVGNRYNRKEDIMAYKTSVEFSPTKSLQFAGSLWYDAKDGGLSDAVISMKYLSQCWGLKFEYIKKPGDSTIMVMFELTGLLSNITGR